MSDTESSWWDNFSFNDTVKAVTEGYTNVQKAKDPQKFMEGSQRPQEYADRNPIIIQQSNPFANVAKSPIFLGTLGLIFLIALKKFKIL